MHTPQDEDFYEIASPASQMMAKNKNCTKGEFNLNFIVKPQHPLVSLTEFLPKEQVETGGQKAQIRPRKVESEYDQALKEYMTIVGTSLVPGIDLSNTEYLSWYNEVALSPQSARGGSTMIVGVFIRAADDSSALKAMFDRREVTQLMEVAEAFNLPVVHILDGQEYELGFGF